MQSRNASIDTFDPFILAREWSDKFEVRSGRPGKKVIGSYEMEDEEGELEDSQVDEQPVQGDSKLEPEPEEGKPELQPLVEEKPKVTEPEQPLIEQPKIEEPPVVPVQIEEPKKRESVRQEPQKRQSRKSKPVEPSPKIEPPKQAKPAIDPRKQLKKEYVIEDEDEGEEGDIEEDDEPEAPVSAPVVRKSEPKVPVQAAPVQPKAADPRISKPTIEAPAHLKSQDKPEQPAQKTQQVPPKAFGPKAGKGQQYTIEVKDEDEEDDKLGSDNESSVQSEHSAFGAPTDRPQISVSVSGVQTAMRPPAQVTKRKGPGSYMLDLPQDDTEEDTDLVQQELITPTTSGDPEQELAKKRWSKKEKHMFCALGCCVFIFMISSFLWIFLFQWLIRKNNFLAGIILYPPTLDTYYKEYDAFWKAYEKNYDVLNDKRKIFGGMSEEELKKFKGLIAAMQSSRKDVLENLDKVKQYLLAGNGGGNVGRRLGLSEEPQRRKLDPHASERIDYVIEDLERLENNARAIRRDKEKHVTGYKEVMRAIEDLYREAFNTVHNYGYFYKLTNRIWVTSENIFRLFQRRFNALSEEIKYDHFKHVSTVAERIVVRGGRDSVLSLIDGVEVKFENQYGAYLVCQISGLVEDPLRQHVGSEFQFELVPENSKVPHQKQEIWNTIYEKETRFVKPQFLWLKAGTHTLKLYGRANSGYTEAVDGHASNFVPVNIEVQELDISCIEMSSYLKFPEYEK